MKRWNLLTQKNGTFCRDIQLKRQQVAKSKLVCTCLEEKLMLQNRDLERDLEAKMHTRQ